MPVIQKYIFNRKLLQKTLARVDITHIENVEQKKKILSNWKHAIESSTLKNAGEVAIHGDFLIDIFSHVLVYKRQIEHPTEWNLTHEQKTKTDATKADGALGFFTSKEQDIRAVIELKNIRTDLDAKQHRKHDKRSPVEQAFGYVHKSGKHCRWVIVSNYEEIRLYHADSSGEYEQFLLPELTEESEFKRFYALLSAENLLAKEQQSFLDRLYSSNEAEEENISKTFYTEYKQVRIHLFEHIKQQNQNYDELVLLEKTQKLLDRFIFVCFCEDTDLLPRTIFRQLVHHAKQSFSIAEQKIWPELRGLFLAIDQGHPARGINSFNGGLFAPDPALDTLNIGDPIFEKLAHITEYDFDSELSVNILGHIFEQSISDLEELKASIQGQVIDAKQGKRKREGVFYTPEYITRYIVEQAVGGWLEERKIELGIEELPELNEQDYASIKHTKTGFKWNRKIEAHVSFWEAYKKVLMGITVLDPACGSGAFLNQAFDFLYKEGQRVNESLASFRQGQTEIFDLDKHILSNNLYGVDLNSESVEITKLSLWLKTANKKSTLTALDDNIRCGNSLIDTPAVAGEKAFQWESEFSKILGNGGFDVIIGNPPYLGGREWKKGELQFQYLLKKFRVAEYQFDMYTLFFEQAIILAKPGKGYISLITPNTWLNNQKTSKLREYILHNTSMVSITDYSTVQVFEDAVVLPIITTLKRERKHAEKTHILVANEKAYPLFSHSLSQHAWNDEAKIININLTERDIAIRDKIDENSRRVDELATVKFGVKLYETGKGKPPQKPSDAKSHIFESDSQLDSTYRMYLEGKDIVRYAIQWRERWLKYGTNLAAHRDPQLFVGERLLVRRIVGKQLICAFTDSDYVTSQLLQIVKPHDPELSKFLLAVLNSQLMAYYFRKKYNRQDKTFPEIRIYELASLPIKMVEEPSLFTEKVDSVITFNNQLYQQRNKFLRFIESSYNPRTVSKKLTGYSALTFSEFVKELKKQKVTLSKSDGFELMELFETQKSNIVGLNQNIERIDKEIDWMVYELYGLTDEEIQIVESSEV